MQRLDDFELRGITAPAPATTRLHEAAALVAEIVALQQRRKIVVAQRRRAEAGHRNDDRLLVLPRPPGRQAARRLARQRPVVGQREYRGGGSCRLVEYRKGSSC